MIHFADLPRPPYFIVAFSSVRRAGDDGYAAMSALMVEMAERQPGFLGWESARDAEGFGITNSYWKDEASIVAWKTDIDHVAAQTLGRERWYSRFEIRIGEVRRAYGFDRQGQ